MAWCPWQTMNAYQNGERIIATQWVMFFPVVEIKEVDRTIPPAPLGDISGSRLKVPPLPGAGYYLPKKLRPEVSLTAPKWSSSSLMSRSLSSWNKRKSSSLLIESSYRPDTHFFCLIGSELATRKEWVDTNVGTGCLVQDASKIQLDRGEF